MIVGRFGKAHGIKGFIHLYSFTEPVDNILKLLPWYVTINGKKQLITIEKSTVGNKSIIVKIDGCNDRTKAETYNNLFVHIEREQLPPLKNDEYYWADLEGLKVVTKEGLNLGTVQYVFATGANDVLAVNKHFIPYIKNVILKVDLEQKTITVDWELN